MVFPLQLKLPVVGGEVKNANSADVLFMALLNVTVILVVTGSLVPVGVFPVTAGFVVSATVVNDQLNADSMLLPAESMAPVPTVTLYVVL